MVDPTRGMDRVTESSVGASLLRSENGQQGKGEDDELADRKHARWMVIGHVSREPRLRG